jgi:carbon starvation protein
MNVLVILLISAVTFWLAARFYGRCVAHWLGETPARPTPAVELADGRDYVPTNTNVLFAHHFSAIAGAGPIVGPTLALLYGYLPVWLWILLGGILVGAVHDFATLFVSLRERGRSMAEVARTTLGTRGFALFLGFAIVMIVLVTSAFLSMTAMSLTSMAPLSVLGLAPDQHLLRTVVVDGVAKGVIGGIASTSVILITLCAPLLGWLLYRRRLRTGWEYLLAIGISVGSIAAGLLWPITLAPQTWMLIIAGYVLFAAGVPVWLVLQPRDFINVQILYAGILALVVGLVVGGAQGMSVHFPALALADGQAKQGALWPMLFITVACGAISGFHALVATGTTAKQLAEEGHARRIGFNGMLLESLLAVCVLLAVGTALARPDYLQIVFPDPASGVKSNPILAFSLSLGLLLNQALGLPVPHCTVFGILLVEGFVVTTLDAAVRLNRYLFEELWPIVCRGRVPALLRWPWFNAALSVVLMLTLAWNNAFTVLWPLFATGNQMLAALSLIAVSAWLLNRQRQAWFTLLPALFMIATTLAALLVQFAKFWTTLSPVLAATPAQALAPAYLGTTLLLLVDLLMLGLSVGVVTLAARACGRIKAGTPTPQVPVG